MVKFNMLIGCPSSGKSTIAEEIFKDYNTTIISSDSIRGEFFGDINDQNHNSEVFNIMFNGTLKCLYNGTSIIYDATNINRRKRIILLKQLPKNCEKIAIVVCPPIENCFDRNYSRDRTIPNYVISRMYRNFQPPSYQEGFDKILYYKNSEDSFSKNNFEENYLCPHDNPNHTLSCGLHCTAAANKMLQLLFEDTERNKKYDKVLITAALWHDAAKFKCKTFTDKKGNISNIAHYYNHENCSAYDFLSENCDDKSFSNGELTLIANLIQNHMIFFNNEAAKNKVKEFYGEEFWKLLTLLNKADRMAH